MFVGSIFNSNNNNISRGTQFDGQNMVTQGVEVLAKLRATARLRVQVCLGFVIFVLSSSIRIKALGMNTDP